MTQEKLELIDGMSASLRRIAQEAKRLNQQIVTLKTSIKALEKPGTLSYLRRELKDVEKQAQTTERAIRSMALAEGLNSRFGAFRIGKNGSYYTSAGVRIPNAQMGDFAASYNKNQLLGMRRRLALWDASGVSSLRTVGGRSFEDRVMGTATGRFFMARNQWSNLQTKWGDFSAKTNMASAGLGSFTNSLFRTVSAIWAFQFVVSSVKNTLVSYFKPLDTYISSLTRVALTSDSSMSPTERMRSLYDMAIRTRSDVGASTNLYNRIALSGVKATNDQIQRFVESFNKVTAISGTTAQENRAVMLQLAQGMGSNRLGGDEFRSIAEQAPLFKKYLAKGMGVATGSLKKMGAEGLLTADAIMKAFMKVQDEIDKIFKDAPWTVGQVLTVIADKWQKAQAETFTGYIEIRNILKEISDWLDTQNGQKFLRDIIGAINFVAHSLVEGFRRLVPLFKWVMQHLHTIGTTIKWILFIWAAGNIVLSIRNVVLWLGLVGQTLGVVFNIAQAGLAAVGISLKACLGWIGLIIGALVSLIYLFTHLSQIHDNLNNWASEQRFVNDYIVKKTEENKGKPQFSTLGGRQQMINSWEAEARQQYRKAHPTEEDLIQQKLIKQQHELDKQLDSIKGMTDSSKNKTVPTQVKNGKLDSVGRINDDITLDGDSIEMMKSIAERQWIMQNEVTVPQQVQIDVSDASGFDDEKFAEALTGGTRIAVASSMRGAPAI